MRITTYDEHVFVDGVEATRWYTKTTWNGRPIFRYKDFVIKFDDNGIAWKPTETRKAMSFYQSTAELELWPRIEKQDRVYFVKILGGRRGNPRTQRRGYVVEPFITLLPGRRLKWTGQIMDAMAKKYGLSDITSLQTNNWGIDAKTGLPIILDFGV